MVDKNIELVELVKNLLSFVIKARESNMMISTNAFAIKDLEKFMGVNFQNEKNVLRESELDDLEWRWRRG